MERRGQWRKRKTKPVIGDPNDPEGLVVWLRRWLEWLRAHNYSDRTVRDREEHVELFIAWCGPRGLGRPHEVTKPILERYQRHLFHYRKKNGRPLAFQSQKTRLHSLRQYFRWLVRQNVLLSNPASELELPRVERRLPKHVLSASEVEIVLALPDLRDPIGLRDRAMLEVLYSTGMRRMELIGLRIFDLDPERGTVTVRQGKGKKDRVIPLGDRASRWVERYLRDVRPLLVVPPDEGFVFLNRHGESFTPDRLTHLVRDYIDQAELGKTGSCHLFRHTMATLMLEGGADVRFVQEMLGHSSLETTQIYTQVSIRKLQEIHAATHPGAKLEPRLAKTAATDGEETSEAERGV